MKPLVGPEVEAAADLGPVLIVAGSDGGRHYLRLAVIGDSAPTLQAIWTQVVGITSVAEIGAALLAAEGESMSETTTEKEIDYPDLSEAELRRLYNERSAEIATAETALHQAMNNDPVWTQRREVEERAAAARNDAVAVSKMHERLHWLRVLDEKRRARQLNQVRLYNEAEDEKAIIRRRAQDAFDQAMMVARQEAEAKFLLPAEERCASIGAALMARFAKENSQ